MTGSIPAPVPAKRSEANPQPDLFDEGGRADAVPRPAGPARPAPPEPPTLGDSELIGRLTMGIISNSAGLSSVCDLQEFIPVLECRCALRRDGEHRSARRAHEPFLHCHRSGRCFHLTDTGCSAARASSSGVGSVPSGRVMWIDSSSSALLG